MIRKGLSEYPLKQILNFKGLSVGLFSAYPCIHSLNVQWLAVEYTLKCLLNRKELMASEGALLL